MAYSAIKAVSMPRGGRKIRRPQHTFNITQNPFAITPFLIAPVIPGETMRSAMMQCRSVSMPIKNDLIGWWMEHYLFYVKLRDLNERDDLTQMFVDPDWSKDPVDSAVANAQHYFNGRNRINYVDMCLRRVVEEYFRDEGEAWNAGTYNGLPLAKSNYQGVFDSIMSEDDYEVPGDIEVDGPDANTTIQAREVEEAMRQWELLKAMNLTEATYEDFIRSFGVRGKVAEQVDPHRPELIRYEKAWTYPANTVEVAGIRSVVSWTGNLRADKDRFFAEPGFIFGVTVARPKVYLTNQGAAGATLLDHIQTWLPAALREDPTTSLVHVADGTGPVTTDPLGYFVDIRDLYIHGDQFVNHALYANGVALPKSTNFDTEYLAATDIEGLFVGATAADRVIRSDGICTFMIASAEAKDYTATTGAAVDVTP